MIFVPDYDPIEIMRFAAVCARSDYNECFCARHDGKSMSPRLMCGVTSFHGHVCGDGKIGFEYRVLHCFSRYATGDTLQVPRCLQDVTWGFVVACDACGAHALAQGDEIWPRITS